jgi:hypothetical protein
MISSRPVSRQNAAKLDQAGRWDEAFVQYAGLTQMWRARSVLFGECDLGRPPWPPRCMPMNGGCAMACADLDTRSKSLP